MNMTKKNALGRGLGALIDGVEKEVLEKKVEANLDISVDSIEANPFQPRTSFDEQSLEELVSFNKEAWNCSASYSSGNWSRADISLLPVKED